MDERYLFLFGLIGPLAAYIFIGVSIALSPWFSWWNNALSDLGHAVRSESASYYNFGLLLTGLLITVYVVTAFWKHAKYTSLFLFATAFSLQLVAVFDEVYGRLHGIVSVVFFVFMILSCLVYAVEKKSALGILSFIIGLGSWVLFWAGVYSAGVAVPEIVSATAAMSWVVLSAIRMFFGRPKK
ncbi:DUF998 domain-containing protein [Candidatus Bathyarchaeota archaeon]|nr:DUF998 domain-containing protein [Candidatus Bathyarchaeota archaeon]